MMASDMRTSRVLHLVHTPVPLRGALTRARDVVLRHTRLYLCDVIR